jgi:hypothetical protein
MLAEKLAASDHGQVSLVSPTARKRDCPAGSPRLRTVGRDHPPETGGYSPMTMSLLKKPDIVNAVRAGRKRLTCRENPFREEGV